MRLSLVVEVALVSVLCAVSAMSQSIPSAADFASETDRQIATLQERARKAPANYAAYDALGAAYFQKARETGDISNFEMAEKALTKALEIVPPDFRMADPLVHISLVYMGEHRFADALITTQKAIALGSGNLAAFAIEGDAYTDRGDYDEASAAYRSLKAVGATATSPTSLSYMVDSRMAYLSFLHGDSDEAIRLMQSAISAGLRMSVPRENLAWLYFELGERYFQAGDLVRAADSYREGITISPAHYRSLAGLAKVLAAQGNWLESVAAYERSINVVPFPQYVAELGDVYTRMGKRAEAQQQYDLVEYIGHLGKLNQVLANRELAMFYADHDMKLDDALELAHREFEVRSDIYTWDTLAWVLYKTHRLPEAVTAMKKALALGTNDSLLLFHAGMIFHSSGMNLEAAKCLTRAVKLNPQFHVLYSLVATQTLSNLAHPVLGSQNSARAAR